MIVMLSSCSDDFEYVFNKTVTERKGEAKTELTSLLTNAEYGWKTTVVVGERMTAGSFYCFNFAESGDNCGKVDIDNGIEKVTSEFEVVHEAGVLLKFTTRNKLLHWLIIPSSMFVEGFGLDQEYIFMKEEDGKLYFQGKELESKLVLEKASKEDLVMENVKANYERMKTIMKSNFKVLSITEGVVGASESDPFYVIFKSPTLLHLLYPDKKDILYRTEYTLGDKNYYDWDAAFLFTPEGVILSKPVVIEGDTIDTFILDDNGEFAIANAKFKGKIIGADLPFFAAPATVDTFFNKLLVLNDETTRGLRMFSTNTSSSLNVLLFDVWENGMSPTFDRIFLVREYVAPDGTVLGDGFVFTDFVDDTYAFIPAEYIKLSNSEFRINLTGGQVISNMEGAVKRIENDNEIKELLNKICNKDGWSMVLYEGYWENTNLYEVMLYNKANPALSVTNVFQIKD